MRWISPEIWRPVGIADLEPAADEAVRAEANTLVTAGPGAGKTELLAQRACFLLQTGKCPGGRRILAVSFKKDAAKNLQERVARRAGPLAERFDSFTLDAFAKGLVDRFRGALPEDWRPTRGYGVQLTTPKGEVCRDWLEVSARGLGLDWRRFRDMSDREAKGYFEHCAHGIRLPYEEGIDPVVRVLGLRWWRGRLSIGQGLPALSFPMLNRLAAYLLALNPSVLRALRATYSHVLLDEWQDTTFAQYDLISKAFQESSIVLTAVGDNKQRIMLWAGAKPAVLEEFGQDFNATAISLLRNYRSFPALVEMQHRIALAIEAATPAPVASQTEGRGICAILEFRSAAQEARVLARLIQRSFDEKGYGPRDVCILVRQRCAEMIVPLQEALHESGLRIRDESELQGLLSEPFVEILVASLRLATRERCPTAWIALTSAVAGVYRVDPDSDGNLVQRHTSRLVSWVRAALESQSPAIEALPEAFIDQVGAEPLQARFREYEGGTYLREVARQLGAALGISIARTGSAAEAVDDHVGTDVIPAMTIHKSKGLEFRTVIFLGLEDSSWWNFREQPEEEKRSLFVAFSRAIERVYFTYSDYRPGRFGPRAQQRDNIGDLYDILMTAGVTVRDCRGASS